MTFILKALFYGDNSGYFQILRDFLYKIGIKETLPVRNSSEIEALIQKDVWPIIIVDNPENSVFDSFYFFDTLYAKEGFELIPFILTGNINENKFTQYAVSAGASGFFTKPLQPKDAILLLKNLLPKPDNIWINVALQTSKFLLAKNYEEAKSGLVQLTACLPFQKAAEIALLRLEATTGQFSKAEERIIHLVKKYPKNIRIFLEIANYYFVSNQFAQASKFLTIANEPSLFINREWQNIWVCLENDKLDSAAHLLEAFLRNQNFRDLAIEAIARMMLSMGLGDYIPAVIKTHSNISKAYLSYCNRIKKDFV